MKQIKKLYQILNVDSKASKEEIKKAYRNIAKNCHPDVSKGREEEFALISTAYQILSDDERRQRYDNGENEKDILNNLQDNIHLKIIADLFCQLITKIDPERDNLIKLIKQNIDQMITNVDLAIKNTNIEIKKLKTAKEKIRHKNENNFLSQVIDYEIQQKEIALRKMDKDRKNFDIAYKEIQEFGYDIIENSVFIQNFGGFGDFTSTAT